MIDIQPDSILEGPFWPEKVRVISVKPFGTDSIKIESVGEKTEKFYKGRILSSQDLEKVKIVPKQFLQFSGNGRHFFLFTEAHRIRNAFQFDPLYAVNVSQVEPLPHQIEAVYYRMPMIQVLARP